MQYTTLGRTGLKVSRLCLGTMNFGPHTTPEDSYVVMDKAHELGINFFDTADVYGWKQGEGVTEKIIGDWFAKGGNRREKTVLATKLYNPMGKGDMEDWPNTRGNNALHIRRAVEDSLVRLKTDYIDLIQMHHVDRSCPWDEIWQAFETLVAQGKVIYVGSSNFAAWNIAQANETARRRNNVGLVCEQSKYSLIQRDIELEVAPACQEYGLGIIPWSPLGSGVLAGVMGGQEGERRRGDWTKEIIEKQGDQLQKWEDLCKEIGEEPANVALAWTLSKPYVTAPIIGPRTMDQLTGATRALEIDITEDLNNKIDEIFPPFKTAPEHYAW